MPLSEFDFIIVGQGLAGSVLATTLIKRGQRVLVLDNDNLGSSTKVAAGIINPITGHRLNISDQFLDYFPIAKAYYYALELDTKQPLFRTIKQTRLIKNQGQFNYLQQRLNETAYQGLLQGSDSSNFDPAEFGVIDIQQTAVVDTKALLSATRKWLEARNSYAQYSVNYSEIKVTKTGVSIGRWQAKQIIFCEGYQANKNPWLAHLPFKLAKGEILTLDLSAKGLDRMLSWGHWLVPDGSNQQSAKLGSNFIWNDLSLNPSEGSTAKMLDSLKQHTGLHGNVLMHEVGIRPTTTDRKPFIGPLSKLEKSYCFNGFGSKGCLLVPYYAELMADHLLLDKTLPEDLRTWV
ncbi:MAG: glycine/D-amino acid oxidase-like deaminating enzyme [Arenicella sp.]|jgi:glycine/D-amino acid oxidase-like deaminating enzyme